MSETGETIEDATEIAGEVRAVRESAGLCRLDHTAVVRVEGPDAFSLLDVTSPGPLFLRESQMRHTLLLDEDARPAADLYVCCDEEGFFLLAEGLSEADLLTRLAARRAERLPAGEVTLRPLSDSHSLLGLNGPYAWEIMAAFLGPSVLGMPYLTLMRVDDIVCFRAGKTGEFGYDLLVPRAAASSSWARLLEVGAPFDLAPVGLAALDLCALENWHFNIRAPRDTSLVQPLTPIELQLQWRVSYQRDFVGAEALRARRAAGAAVRATSFVAAQAIAPGQAILFEGWPCGEVLASALSPTLGAWTGIALLPVRLAHPGIADFVAQGEDAPVAITTRTPPLINNRSLFVDPHRHSYRTRAEETFPPLVVV